MLRTFHKTAFILLAFLICIKPVHGQEIQFNHITPNDGLSTGNVWGFVQDYLGFFWFATEDGLHQYDGYSINIYRSEVNNPSSVSSNYISLLYQDSYNNLWIGTTDGGLCLYDRRYDKFRRFTNEGSEGGNAMYGLFVRAIYESNGYLYVGYQEGGISYFKISSEIPEKLNVQNFKIPPVWQNIRGNSICDIAGGANGKLLVGLTGGGINLFDPATSEFEQILKDSVNDNVQSLFVDSKNRLWVGSWLKGLFVYSFETGQIKHHPSGNKPGRLQNNQIEAIAEDLEGNIWIGTDNGLGRIKNESDPFQDNIFETFRHNNLDASSLLSNSVKSLFVDSQNRLWIGTYYGGINIYDKNAKPFNTIQSKSWQNGSLSHSNVTAFAEDHQGNIWIGTDGGGLNFLSGGIENIFKSSFVKFDLVNRRGEKEEKIKCLEVSPDGTLWVGTWGGGMFQVDTESGKYLQYTSENGPVSGLPTNEVMSIKSDHNSNLWIGTFYGGLVYLDREEKKFHKMYHPTSRSQRTEKIYSVFVDKNGMVWIAKELGGLDRYNPKDKTRKSVEFSPMKNDFSILSIFQDQKEIFWLATNTLGLIRYDDKNQSFKVYNKSNGLKNEVVHSIQQDVKTGKLWISTNEGLAVFDPDTEEFVNYSKTDGLQGNQFNNGSSMVSKDGLFLFGGTKGMNAFYPEKVNPSNVEPRIVFTNFWLENIERNIKDPKSPLKENISLASTINLGHRQNSFSIAFAALEYHFSRKNEYAYMLEGFDTNWQKIGTERKVTFTNLNPGKYVLKVKATNSDGIWMPNEKTLEINIIPAWWQTHIFRVFSVFSILLIGYVVHRLRLNYLIRHRNKLEKLVVTRTAELKLYNEELGRKMEEIKTQNETLHKQKLEIADKNQEILTQNQELLAQNDQIILQQNDLKRAQELLEQINSQLEELVAQRTNKLEDTIKELDKTVFELDRFVYSASHDLSAPLKSILGLVNIAKVEQDPEQLKSYYTYMEESVRKLELVIKSLVEYSRNTHQEIKSAPFNIYHLAEEVFFELRFSPEAQSIRFYNLVDPGTEIIGDRYRLKVILHNLISNGIKYADLKKDEPFIKIYCEVEEGKCRISVSDNGIGISNDKLGKVFEMYYRGTHKSSGSGLGLYIVREIVHKLQGSIDVHSVYGRESTFILELPIMLESYQPA